MSLRVLYQVSNTRMSEQRRTRTYSNPVHFLLGVLRQRLVFNLPYFAVSFGRPVVNVRVLLAKFTQMPFDAVQLALGSRDLR